MKQELAYAMAFAFVVGAVGLSVVPIATAGHSNCHADFSIPDSEPADSNARSLQAGESEVGGETVSALLGSETLHIELVDAGANGELNWTVFEKDGSSCVVYTDGGCNGSTPNTIRTPGQQGQDTCTLQAPGSGSMEYRVLFEAGQQNAIEYKTWVS